MKTRSLVVAAAVAWLGALPLAAGAQTRPVSSDAEAGRALALRACAGCHVVEPTHPVTPRFLASPHPPDFKDIANQPNLTTASLQHHLQTLPEVPQEPSMANPDLTDTQLRYIVAFILTLRDRAASPGR